MLQRWRDKISGLETPYLQLLILTAMLLFLLAQLVWWIVFFERNNERAVELARTLDRVQKKSALISHEERIRSEHDRRMIMLISETLVVLLVISYGFFRVWRSMREEIVLNRMRHILMNSVSHELKTPLASLLLNLQTLKKRKLGTADRQELLEAGIEDVRRLNQQVNNVLTAGAIMRNRRDLSRRNFSSRISPERIIRDMLSENRSLYEEAGVHIVYHSECEGKIRMVREMFRTICDNLIQNAVAYAGPDSHIEVTLSKLEPKSGQFFRFRSYALLEVKDDGPGLPENELENIFKPLYRLPGPNTAVGGSGMGLYIISEIVRTVGGKITAKNRSGGGAIFQVELPLSPRDV